MTGSFHAERIADRYASVADKSREGRVRFIDRAFAAAVSLTGKTHGRLPQGAREEAMWLCLSLYRNRGHLVEETC